MEKSKRGYGITFMDLDETLFKTFAKVHVVKDGLTVRTLTNKEFNTYSLGEGESFDFREFVDAKFFRETSVAIPRTLKMLKELMEHIKKTNSSSRIIILTARRDFPDKETFLKAFTDNGIDVSNKELLYIDRMGNSNEGTVAGRKRDAVVKYLSKGIYRRCRMIDDDRENLEYFLSIENTLPEEIREKVRQEYSLSKKQKPISFFAIHIGEDGVLEKLKSKL